MSDQKPIGVGDFLIWFLLCLCTFGIYTLWWTYSRAETVYREVASRKGASATD